MQRKLLIIVLLTCLLTAGCLHTEGEAPMLVWIDAPQDGDLLFVDSPTAIMAHTNIYGVGKMWFEINDSPLGLLEVRDYGNGLWEGKFIWTPVLMGDYDLRVGAATSDEDWYSDEISVEVGEISISPMLF
jgi:hypothetical protein